MTAGCKLCGNEPVMSLVIRHGALPENGARDESRLEIVKLCKDHASSTLDTINGR